jgi:hypothetical protein
LGQQSFENDKVEKLGQQSFEAKLAAATALSVGAPPSKKLRTQDGCPGRSATEQVIKVGEPTQLGNPNLEGFWKSEDGIVCAKISSWKIKFSTGEAASLRKIAKKKVSLRMDDEIHTGFVNNNYNVIVWSDRDKWFFLGKSPPPGVFADSKQDGEVGADAVNEWVQMQWTSLTEPTQESNPKAGEKRKDASQKTDVIKKRLSTPGWTPDQRVLLREKIQALLVDTPTEVRDRSPSSSSRASTPESSRSSSRRTSRSPSQRTPERARLFHGPSSPQKRRDSIVPPPPPGSPGRDGVFVPPPPPESPPPPPPDSPTSVAIQTQQPSPTTLVRRRCVWPAQHLKIGPDSFEEIDVEADIRRLIALDAVSHILADNIFP